MFPSFVLLVAGLSAAEPADLTPNVHVLRQPGHQADFPVLAADSQGTPWIAYVEWDGNQDALRLAKLNDGKLAQVLSVGRPGIIHQPALAAAKGDVLVVVWSQVNEKDLMELKAQRVRDGHADGEEVTLASSEDGGNVFARAAADRAGRVWVVWQSMRGKLSDVYCRWYDPAANRWSGEVQVTSDPAGQWEPCVAFDAKDGAWVIYDGSQGNEFNVYANRVTLDGQVGETCALIQTDRYEGRTSAIGTPDGRGIWLTCERGNQQWGLDMRAHGGVQGLNGRKDSVLAYWDLASGHVEEMPAIDPRLAALPGPPSRNKPAKKAAAAPKAKPPQKNQPAPAKKPAANKPRKTPIAAVNLPQVWLDGEGRPWVTIRYFKDYCWRIALARFDRQSKRWTEPFALPDAAYGQDRRTGGALAADGTLWICWPSDLRNSKTHRTAGIQLAKIETEREVPLVDAPAANPREPFAGYINPTTPERRRDDRHSWTHGGTTYKLYWGDYHRHTDVSNCVTPNDGCIVEQFRYAWDMGKLDTLGTSDHTDVGKIYHPYEWWLNQKLVDVFYAPGFFASMYAYEREQRWPYGHRNVVFAQRGGPVVYIQRRHYLASPWQRVFPVKTEGPQEISPQELWDVLTRYGRPVTAISHTGATRMGTDWNIFDSIDYRVENLIEIYQGARVSYEGRGAPQPTVGLRERERYNAAATLAGDPLPGQPIRSFTDKDNGLYQNALARGHKLGVWANSDHISTHTSFGGVYVKEFTREGIIEGLNARRTIAATDKIFVEFTCNDELLGSEIEAEGPLTLAWKIDGTSELSQVTLVRNEENYQQWQPGTKRWDYAFKDGSPQPGESRYYLRVEQNDGNMAWSSPVWVSVKQPEP